MANGQRNGKLLAIIRTELGPGVGIGRKTMMDMDGRYPAETKTAQHMEQDNGITTSGEPHPKVGVQLKTGGEKRANPLPEIS